MFASRLARVPKCASRRFISSTASSGRQSALRQLLKQPIFKSIFLTLLFGSVTIDLMRNKKNLEAMESSYRSKITILEDIVTKLQNNESVNIAQELKLANALTKNRYNSVTDIEFDKQLENFMIDLSQNKENTTNSKEERKEESHATKKATIKETNAVAGQGEEQVVLAPVPEKRVEIKRQPFTSEAKQRETSKFL
ncbi:hypothetical protein CLIB1423_08S02190 [[Candida] railenensis]|uniref:Uncharacterized protein n=1 Tax=[Candida] railenensis TaxID=45579 RepID=A0A9P0QQ61_9ASCO|nr:hypothetical protein CLIB1423_08S02190 [[Candida] railenensis]